MVEAKKLAFADRDAAAGDVPAFDAEALFTADHAAARRLQIGGKAADHTTYLAAVDRDGNAVSLIESVFSEFGAAFLAPGTGILANNRLAGFSLAPKSPNALAPRKRPLHTLNTVLVTDGARPRFIFGTPGRDAQVQTNFQLAVALIDFEMDVQEAIDAPRWFHERGRRLQMEGRWPEDVRRAVAARGHQVEVIADWAPVTGGAQAIAVDETGVFSGGADPRREGYAAGY
jgi:gamma-glutamyltranspeptidase/glutathione hydrolase